jgi:cysteine synthase A
MEPVLTSRSRRRGNPAIAGVLGVIGNTPLIRLERMFPDAQFELYAKLESLNPGGSIKDRPALHMLRLALEAGHVTSRSVIVESSSGNMAIGLAQACCYLGLRLICVVDAKTPAATIALLSAYGVEVDVVRDPDVETGEYLPVRLARVRSLLAQHPDSYWPNQYANVENARAHHETMREIVEALGHVDYLFCAASTCGTLRGCAEYARAHELDVRIVAVDAVGSVIFGGTPRKRLVPGHGAAVRPALYQDGLAHEVVLVTDHDCVVGCRRLLRREALLAGGSSGAVVTAVQRLRPRIPTGARCVVLLPDRGERYLDTIYSDAWVRDHFTDVSRPVPEVAEPMTSGTSSSVTD